MNSMNVLVVGSSMREGAHDTRTVKIVLNIIKRYDAKTRLLDLREITMPIFNPNHSFPQQS
jgi:hypothetical protein